MLELPRSVSLDLKKIDQVFLYNFFSQISVNRGTILRMGKGFTLKNTEGRDLSDMLHEAFQRKVVFKRTQKN